MFEFLYEYVEKESLLKYIRLSVIVGFYLIFRQQYSEWNRKKQVKKQVEEDLKEKNEASAREEQEEKEKEESLEKEASSFGWGKKTRRNVKQKEKVLGKKVEELRDRQQASFNAAEDHDIEQFLEE